MEISIVIPAYNEEKRIENTIEKILNFFRKKNTDFEIIVVDDGSKDNTYLVAKSLKEKNKEVKIIKHAKNKGKGGAVKTGILNASGNYILFTDADLSTPIEEIDKLLYWIKEKNYDIVIGSRSLQNSKILTPQPFYRRIIGRIFPVLVRIILTNKFKDTQCGFKLFKNQIAKEIFNELKTENFAFDVEVLYRALKKGYKIKEIGVIWINSPYSTVKIFKDPFKMLFSLLKIKFKC